MMRVVMPDQQNCARHGHGLKLHRGEAFGEVSIAPSTRQTPAIPPIVKTGPIDAINNLTLGVAANSPERRKRGGARNRSDRVSDALSTGQIANLKAATAHAATIGLPFTRMITVHWEAAGVPLVRMAKATGRFTDLLSKTLARHGFGSAWLWVHEGGPQKGGHCHLLAHVPAVLVKRLSGLLKRWLRAIAGKPYRKGVVHSVPIGGRLGLELSNPELHAINLEAALRYLLKGANPEAAAQFRLERLEHGGRIIGKRCGTSQNIGRKARGT